MTRWDEAARKRQAELIQQWRPWERSTGPRSLDGKAKSAQNARRTALSDEELVAGLRKMRLELGAIAKVQQRREFEEMWNKVMASFEK